MTNDSIVVILELTSKLLELHAENEFKIRNFGVAVYNLDKTTADLSALSVADLALLPGVGKSMAVKIDEIRQTGQLSDLTELLSKTPEGVVEMFGVKGIGPKKIRSIWLELGITDIRELLLACENGEVAKLKGFGDKIQTAIMESILFMQSNTSKLRMDKAETLAQTLYDALESQSSQVEMVGDIRRKNEVVTQIQWVVGHKNPSQILDFLNTLPNLQPDAKASGPFVWRGKFEAKEIPVEVLITSPERFTNQVFIHSASAQHLKHKGLLRAVQSQSFNSEEAIYAHVGLPYIVPEMREGRHEFDWATTHATNALVTWEALKGTMHNHSTYSDGKHTLEQMARYAQEIGLEYLGIADHSKAAQYAKGMSEETVLAQHQEIDALNKSLAPFKIFKGIEADILGDGSLDYTPDFLRHFDFVVASVHSNLKMTFDKAMSRVMKAVENPQTTILGHPTGRLLLSREGYPLDHRKVIDACAANGVVIELNASPYRLDIDWRWIDYCLQKGVMISINPDAHEMKGYHDMHYGVAVARKGGLTANMTFNALTLKELEVYLEKQKR